MRGLFVVTLSTLLLGVLLSGPAVAAKVYKWKDAHGVMHYSRTPPADGQADSLDIHVRDDPGAVKHLAAQKEKSAKYFEQRQEAKKEAAEKARDKAQLQAACDNAHERLTGLQQSQRIYKTDAAGNRVRVGEKVRQARIKQAREDIAKYCK